MEKLEKIPVQGDSYCDEYMQYTVQLTAENRIKKVQVTVLPVDNKQ
jgi:Mg2+/Co2+ transporter CorB